MPVPLQPREPPSPTVDALRLTVPMTGAVLPTDALLLVAESLLVPSLTVMVQVMLSPLSKNELDSELEVALTVVPLTFQA